MSETAEQQTVIEWARWMQHKYPALKNLYHVPNEGKRSKMTAAIVKSMGLKSGVPDLILDYPSGIYHGLRIELKYGRNKPTDNQIDWLQRMQSAKYFVAICWSSESAIQLIDEYIKLSPGSVMKIDNNKKCREKWGVPALK